MIGTKSFEMQITLRSESENLSPFIDKDRISLVTTGNRVSDFNGSVDMSSEAEDMFYRMLRDFPGWEINEGSQGQCIIDMDLEQMQLDFNENYEEQKVDEIWTTS